MGHVFGPVPSRRLGRSLGVDVVPYKTCTYDCIYCQLGRTTTKTVTAAEWVPVDEILEEVEVHLPSSPDFVTLGGSGEPTLYEGLGELIDGIKRLTTVPVAVLTNGSLLWRPDVRAGLLAADLVIPSLDVGDEALFRAVNRPHDELRFEDMVQGLVDLRRAYRGQMWLEVLLLAGYTGYEPEVRDIARYVKQIGPDRVHLNTVVRPPAESFAEAVPHDRLESFCELFEPHAEVIAASPGHDDAGSRTADETELRELLRRRPCSIEDLARGLRLHRSQAIKLADRLTAAGRIRCVVTGGILYYTAK